MCPIAGGPPQGQVCANLAPLAPKFGQHSRLVGVRLEQARRHAGVQLSYGIYLIGMRLE
jgi:hypothetical protein